MKRNINININNDLAMVASQSLGRLFITVTVLFLTSPFAII